MTTYRVVTAHGKYFLSPVYGSGNLPSDNLVAGPFQTLSDAEDAKVEFLALDRKYSNKF
jgi:hypothetical protein